MISIYIHIPSSMAIGVYIHSSMLYSMHIAVYMFAIYVCLLMYDYISMLLLYVYCNDASYTGLHGTHSILYVYMHYDDNLYIVVRCIGSIRIHIWYTCRYMIYKYTTEHPYTNIAIHVLYSIVMVLCILLCKKNGENM